MCVYKPSPSQQVSTHRFGTSGCELDLTFARVCGGVWTVGADVLHALALDVISTGTSQVSLCPVQGQAACVTW